MKKIGKRGSGRLVQEYCAELAGRDGWRGEGKKRRRKRPPKRELF